ncbi:MAG: hypothetical protein JSV51_06450 [Candidatus Bathyarchaeota archaeon]|nr:MAG: hypothetical protein JSV51_06450 [Candidatus Bathyarchaeota archaeon]
MKPLTAIYWTRAGLGIVIGVLCALYVYFSVSSELASIYTLLTGLSFAMLFYIASFYVIKPKFSGQIEKPSKLVTQGIGIYFFAWLVSWILILTLLMPSVSVSIYADGILAEGSEFQVFVWKPEGLVQKMNTSTGTLTFTLLPPGSYIIELTNPLEGYSVENQTITVGWLQSKSVNITLTQASE